jgi:glycogen debranching enzyme
MLPVFYPVIHEKDPDWHLLAQNYSYTFKNKPYHFHNGGCWPVFMGLLGLGLAKQGLTIANAHMYQALLQALKAEVPSFGFHEYWSGDTHQPGGVTPLCYTASGFLLLHQAAHPAHLSLNKLVP